ncbi:MAG TPA: TM0106 family RecB-like putative nuclease [Syntrophales bacterium]|nr:TM0106 family RecB-like putative nuclease [Syntrophales bacterium]
MKKAITASMLYNLVQCPHRVVMDLFGDPTKRDPVNAFVQLLWDRGNLFEREVIEGLDIPFTNLRPASERERERLTLEAMRRGDSLIYAGRIAADDLLGEPDLLRRRGSGYVAGDIKSGAGEEGSEGGEEGKPKKHYAVQLALYTDILERLGLSAGRVPFIWDVHGNEVIYDLNAQQGVRNTASLWDLYLDVLDLTRKMVGKIETTRPALAAQCKLCHWRSACIKCLEELDDLTLIPELGRTKRDAMLAHIQSVKDLSESKIEGLIQGRKTVIPGIGSGKLLQFHERALLQKTPGARPYLRESVALPSVERELFFDIETDPMRDICYLHGFVERIGGDRRSERYVAFFADNPTPEEEEQAFAAAWEYIKASMPCAIYYYSPYERTIWRKLQRLYPHVASGEEINAMFGAPETVDLFADIVRPKSEWPTRDHSIKTLAYYLGFKWRDTDPSGAGSIEWYHRWVETKDEEVKKRILEYNEDDCIAMRVLRDAIGRLEIKA